MPICQKVPKLLKVKTPVLEFLADYSGAHFASNVNRYSFSFVNFTLDTVYKFLGVCWFRQREGGILKGRLGVKLIECVILVKWFYS